MSIVYILCAILIFGVLIAVHELGHFLATRFCGVTVHEFSIGMGPALWKRTGKTGTQYSVRLLPIGGFCALEGEEEASDDPGSLNNKGFFQKILVFAAGAGMNFLAGLLILLALYAGADGFYLEQITGLAPEFPYQGEDGLLPGDVIYKVDGWRAYVSAYSVEGDMGAFPNFGGGAQVLISYADGTGMDLEVLRDGRRHTLRGIERRTYTGNSGETYTGFGIYLGYRKEAATWGAKLRYAWDSALADVQTVWFSLSQLLSGRASTKELSGPVGIVTTITAVGEQSGAFARALRNIGSLAALIAVNLAVMNLLPLPALDGGKIFFLALNALLYAVCKKQIPPKYEGYVHLAGLALLMGLMLFVTFQDVARLFA